MKENDVQINISRKLFRHLLDMAYVGNEVLNGILPEQGERIREYDEIISLLFSRCKDCGLDELCTQTPVQTQGKVITMPSREYLRGGICDVLDAYDDQVFFESLAEELAYHDVGDTLSTEEDFLRFNERMDGYMREFAENGAENVYLDVELD